MSYKRFRGADVRAVTILNNLLSLIERYELENRFIPDDTKAVLYLGRKEMDAIHTIEYGDVSIDRNTQSGEIRLYGIKVVPVALYSYSAVHTSIVLDIDRRKHENQNETDSESD